MSAKRQSRLPRDGRVSADKTLREHLAASGLTPELLGARALTNKETCELLARLGHPKEVVGAVSCPAVYLSYYDQRGFERTDHAAIRFLTDEILLPSGLRKYLIFDPRARGGYAYTPPAFYLPKNLRPGWTAVAKDTNQRIVFVEGQKKAAVLCQRGVAAIGLEGVHNFVRCADPDEPEDRKRGRKKSPSIALEDFDDFEWPNRLVEISYDSDRAFKPEIGDAQRRLAELLMRRGAQCAWVNQSCECSPPCKGADDFIVEHGFQDYENLPRVPFDETDRVALRYVKLPKATVYDRTLRELMGHAKFLIDASSYKTLKLGAFGRVEEISAAKVWSESPSTTLCSRLIFDPAGPPEEYTEDPRFPGQTAFNCYRRQSLEARQGDITPYLELLRHAFPNEDDRKRFEQWAAYPHQHPGAKINYVILMLGRPGIGKTILGQIIGNTYGGYFRHVDTPEAVHEKFNSLSENKLFFAGDELLHSRVEAERLKNAITLDTMEIERKGIDKYTADNRINYYFTANRADALKLDELDRRWWVHFYPDWNSREERRAFFKRVGAWLFVNGNEGPIREDAMQALLYHFLHEVDCSDFEPKGDAPMTTAKREMIGLTRDDVEDFVAHLCEDPKELLGNTYTWAMTFESLFACFLLHAQRSSRPGDQRELRVALRQRGFEFRLFCSRFKKGESRQSRRLVIVDAEWRKGKTDHEIFEYHEGKSNPEAGGFDPKPEDGAYRPAGAVPAKVTDIRRGRR